MVTYVIRGMIRNSHQRENYRPNERGKKRKEITADDFDFVHVCNRKIRKPLELILLSYKSVNLVFMAFFF